MPVSYGDLKPPATSLGGFECNVVPGESKRKLKIREPCRTRAVRGCKSHCDFKVAHNNSSQNRGLKEYCLCTRYKGPGEWLAGKYSPRSSHSTLRRDGRFISSLGMRLSICVSEFARLDKSSAWVTYMPPFNSRMRRVQHSRDGASGVGTKPLSCT